jgi:hypothetical protein
VAVTAREGRYQWLVGTPDPAAMGTYLRPQIEAWRRSDPSRATATNAPTRFPTPADRVVLTARDDAIIAVDEHSGARWTLDPAAEHK